MSVLACNRAYCPNIMCDRLILNGEMYICNDCFKELLKFKETWNESVQPIHVDHLIRQFMTTALGTYTTDNKDSVEEEFKRLTDLNRDYED